MADPPFFSTFGDQSASEIANMQSGIPEQGARPAVSSDDFRVPVLTRPEGAQPSASFLGPSPRAPERERERSFPTGSGPSRQVYRDWPQPPRPYQPYQPYQRPPSQQPPAPCPRQRPLSRRPPFLPPSQQLPAQYFAIPPQSRPDRGFDGPYPFKRECIRRIFRALSEMPDSPLPAPAGPSQANLESHPYYCPYHQLMGHALEDCYNFKEWLNRAVTEGSVVLPAACLVDPITSSESYADNSAGSWPASDDS